MIAISEADRKVARFSQWHTSHQEALEKQPQLPYREEDVLLFIADVGHPRFGEIGQLLTSAQFLF